MAHGDWNAAKTFLAVAVGVLAAASYLWQVRPRVVASTQGVEVVNPLRSWAVPWHNVVDIRATDRIEIVRRDSRCIRAEAPTEPMADTLTGGETLERMHRALARQWMESTGSSNAVASVERDWSRAGRRLRTAVGVFVFVTYLACMAAIRSL